MVNFITSILRANRVEDGTRRAAMETVMTAREGLEDAKNQLSATIRDLLRENDRATKRQPKNDKANKK